MIDHNFIYLVAFKKNIGKTVLTKSVLFKCYHLNNTDWRLNKTDLQTDSNLNEIYSTQPQTISTVGKEVSMTTKENSDSTQTKSIGSTRKNNFVESDGFSTIQIRNHNRKENISDNAKYKGFNTA